MKRNRQSRIVAILALCVSVVGLTLGFAAFSNTLTISSSATVSPDKEDFKIVFSANEDPNVEDYVVEPILSGGATADPITLINGETPAIPEINAVLTEPDQSVIYEIYAHNKGQYTAYWKELIISAVGDTGKTIVCTPAEGSGATDSLVQQACSYINMQFYDASDNEFADFQNNKFNISLGSMPQEKNTSFKFYIKISYQDVKNNEVGRADGLFDVEFGRVQMNYSTVQ